MEGIINWFSKNHVAANFLMLIVVVFGCITWPTLKKEIFPETAIDAIAITVPYPNAAPDEVEKGVIIPIEEEIQDLDGISAIRSTASQSAALISVEAAVGYGVRDLMDDLKTRIDAVQNIAEGAEEPVIEQLILKNQVLSIAVSAKANEASLRELAEKVRSSLLNYRGGTTKITQAYVAGAREYEISIEVSEATLRQYNLSLAQVGNAVRASSLDLPGGSVKTSTGEVLIRTEAKRYTAAEFATITVVSRPDGSVVKLGDIANIIDGFDDESIDTRLNGNSTLLVNVMRVGNEDTLKIADTVRHFLENEAPKIVPDQVSLEIWKDDSAFLRGRLDLLVRNGLSGLILVGIVLALFLRPSLAILVAIGIPVSFCGAVWMMPQTGISINLISLFAFILVLGIVVDDAIVVGENVYSRMRKGEHPKIASPKGTHEVGVIVIFGILTTVMAFTPMLGLSGVSGKIWPNIPLIVIPTLIFSLFQSKLILPAHLALLPPINPNKKPNPIIRFQQIFAHGLEKAVDKLYRPLLKVALANRWVVAVLFFCSLVIILVWVASGRVKSEFFPKVEADVITAKLTLAQGVPYSMTYSAVKQLEAGALKLNDQFTDNHGNPIIKNLLASSGTQPFQVGFDGILGAPRSSNIGEVTVELQSGADRDITGIELISAWRENTGSIPGAVDLVFRTETEAGGNAIDLELTGPDLDDLNMAADELKAALGEMKGVIDISDSNREGKRELKLEILPNAEALGLRLQDVAIQVRQAFYGDEVQRLQRGKDEVKVFVRYPKDERLSVENLNSMMIRTMNGTEVPFSSVAKAKFGRSISSIQRTDRQRAIRITADVDKAKGANANQIIKTLTRGST
ncbi:MAG: efflux RND transporter permease subunit, partial [Verrucomicrobiota bacterium]